MRTTDPEWHWGVKEWPWHTCCTETKTYYKKYLKHELEVNYYNSVLCDTNYTHREVRPNFRLLDNIDVSVARYLKKTMKAKVTNKKNKTVCSVGYLYNLNVSRNN